MALRNGPTAGLAKALAKAYGAAVAAREAAFGSGLVRPKTVAGVAVLSVGGLTVGGSGKTPLAMHLAGALRDRGVPTAVVSRGYRGAWEHSGGVVSDGTRVFASVAEAGDEPLLAAIRLPGVAVVVGSDRVAATERARARGAR